MSDTDNLYEFHEDSHGAIEIPPPQQKEEEEPTNNEEQATTAPVTTTEDDESDHLYDSVDEDEEEQRLSQQKEGQEVQAQDQTTEQVSQEQKDPEQQEEDDDEEEEEEYDPTANISTVEPVSLPGLSPNTEAKQESETHEEDKQEAKEEVKEEKEDDEDDEYDPVSSSDAPTEAKVEQTPPTTASTPTTDSASVNPNLASELTLKLFSDPEFTKLSYADQQKRVLAEFSKLSSTIPTATGSSAAITPEDNGRGAHRPNFDIPMSLAETQKYNTFVDNESKYHRYYPFKPNARLYVGNLPANFSKENIFRMFSVYGDLLHIAMKNTYAFLQFEDPQSVLNAIKAEEGTQLYKKDLILEVAKNSMEHAGGAAAATGGAGHGRSLPPQSAIAPQRNAFHESRKRARDDYGPASRFGGSNQKAYGATPKAYGAQANHYGGNNSNEYGGDAHGSQVLSETRGGGTKRRNYMNIDCKMFIKQTAESYFAKEATRKLQQAHIVVDFEYLKAGQNLEKKINDAAYSGILSVALVNKNRTLDIFIYENIPDGGIRFDEYMSISVDDAVSLLTRAKEKTSSNKYPSPSSSSAGPRFNQSPNQYNAQPVFNQQPQQPQQADLLQSLQSLPPQALQNLLSLASGVQPPQQQFQQPTYQQPAFNQFQQPQQNTGVDLASLLSKLQPHQQQQQPQPVQPQPVQPQTFGYQPQYQQSPPQQPQQQPQQQQQQASSNIASLLATLSNLNQGHN